MSDDILLLKNGPYYLLQQYLNECNILSFAYKNSENYFRNVYKCLTYPLIVTSAVTSVLSVTNITGNTFNGYVIPITSLVTLVLVGFNSAINPMDRSNKAHQVSREFGELASSINHFILENSKSNEEIKLYNQHILTQLEIWKNLSPHIQNRFISQATLNHNPKIKKLERTRKESQITI